MSQINYLIIGPKNPKIPQESSEGIYWNHRMMPEYIGQVHKGILRGKFGIYLNDIPFTWSPEWLKKLN